MPRVCGHCRRLGALVALLLAVALGGNDSARGQQTDPPSAEGLTAARRLMEASGADKHFDDIIPRMLSQIQSHISRRDPAEARMVREVFSRVSARLIRDKGELLGEIIKFYAGKLTVAEMDEITRFYQSPAGAKLISLSPELAQRTVEISQSFVVKLTGEVRQELEAERKRRREEEAEKEKREAPKQ